MRLRGNRLPQPAPNRRKPASLREVYTRLSSRPSRRPRFAPGTPGKAYYSSTGYRLLGEIVESVTGRTVAANFKERIFDPRGLRRTYSFDWTAPRPGDRPAAIFVKKASVDVPKYLTSDVADGNLVSTASESVTFLRAFFEGRLFDGELLPRMMTWKPIFFPLRYGYRLMDMRVPRLLSIVATPELIGHSGSSGPSPSAARRVLCIWPGRSTRPTRPAGPMP